jgi:DNA-binding NarL/FixJ family response regulator
MTIRVMLADDQTLVRAGITMLLEVEPDIEVIGEVCDGTEAVEMARQRRPDVVLMDVRMPGLGGVEATRIITADGFFGDGTANAKVINVLILTTYHVDDAVHAALRAGACGFLLKDSAPRELVAAVRAVSAGDGWLDPTVTKKLIAEFAARPDQHLATPDQLAQLTSREREVLALAAEGLCNDEIARTLFIGQATVKTHLSRVLMKLGARDRVGAVVIAYKTGLARPDSEILVPRPSKAGVAEPRFLRG